jgi:histidine triad (HIT) family protein
MATIFSKIISEEIPSFKIAENERFLAFLDIQPLALGHTLVIPKIETDYIFDMDSEEYSEMWKFAQTVAKNLVQINNVNDINFAAPKLNVSMEMLEEIASKINS